MWTCARFSALATPSVLADAKLPFFERKHTTWVDVYVSACGWQDNSPVIPRGTSCATLLWCKAGAMAREHRVKNWGGNENASALRTMCIYDSANFGVARHAISKSCTTCCWSVHAYRMLKFAYSNRCYLLGLLEEVCVSSLEKCADLPRFCAQM